MFATRLTRLTRTLAASDPDVANSLKVVDATIMFLDVKNFTGGAERLDPRELVGVLNRLFAIAVPVINAHGGHVDKFMGDGIMAFGGAPAEIPNPARAAVGVASLPRDAAVEADAIMVFQD